MLHRTVEMRKLGIRIVALVALLLGTALLADSPEPVHSQVPAVDPQDDAVAAAQDFLRRNAGSYGLRSDLSDLKVQRVERSLSADHVHFQQTVQGIPVYGGEIAVHVDKKRVQAPSASSRYKKAAAALAATAPSFASDHAVAAAAKHVGMTGKARRKAETGLVAYPKGDSFVLAWGVRVASSQPLGDWEVFVDATTGAVLESFNRLRQDSFGPDRR